MATFVNNALQVNIDYVLTMADEAMVQTLGHWVFANRPLPAQESSPSPLSRLHLHQSNHEASGCAEESQSELFLKKRLVEEQQAPVQNMEQSAPDDQADNNEDTSAFAIDDLLDSMNRAQTLMESCIVRDMNSNHQRMSDELNTLSSQMAEVINCLKELGDVKKGKTTRKEDFFDR
ncbi:(6-4)DNA photolyase [Dorcoceras hygrometricum]|uniref:(6-4)DNA photolyase n=1 Tax=Dorcoceras hygrometricum TaxID=472368 RepID=A0A2Z7CN20_9LAMI|nr:(6-4)DNA photolyase [Dorcoceras hygrometricum]